VLALGFCAFALTKPEELWSIHGLRRRSLSRERTSHLNGGS
jgi:hypothetical protein